MAVSPRLCLSPILDGNGVPQNGALVYVYQAGTTTKIDLFTDSGLSSAAANPMVASQGFVPLRFMATQSYKLVVTTSANAPISYYNGDNIDPGVAVGAGALPVANGGTGATTAANARTNLAAAAASDMATAQSDISDLQTWGGFNLTTRTRIASGTTAQQPAAGTVGIRYNSTTGFFEADNGTNWKNLLRQGQALPADFATGSGVFMLQQSRVTSQTNGTSSTAIPHDSTKPQITEGAEAYTTTFTPKSASSQVRVRALLNLASNAADVGAALALFKNGGTDAVAADTVQMSSATMTAVQLFLEYWETPGSTSAITYALRYGPSAAATLTINSPSFNGLRSSHMTVEEWLSP